MILPSRPSDPRRSWIRWWKPFPGAGDALTLLNLGFSPDEILQDLELKKPDTKVDTEDFVKALQTDEARSRFFVAEDDLELQAILQAPLERWRVFLHPSQRKIVEKDWNGPVRVLGGAGTERRLRRSQGRWLVQSVLKDPNERVLFTTFTVNLARIYPVEPGETVLRRRDEAN